MKRCMYCGHENEDSLVTCAVCGNRLGDPVPTQEVVIVDSSAAAGAQGAAGAAQEGMSSLTDGMPGESGQAAGSAAAALDMALPSDTAVPGMTAGAEDLKRRCAAREHVVDIVRKARGIVAHVDRQGSLRVEVDKQHAKMHRAKRCTEV